MKSNNLCIVEKRGDYHFAVLGPNPDAGKQGVCYSGDYFTICTTDGPDEAKKIAKALNILAAIEAIFG
jgi:hypothetical protein